MIKIVLPNTSLCAIVRDEMMNPAGGIRRFVESHVPFVEEAAIVDTGSIDGTREELESLQKEFPNLRVYDHKFIDYATARNISLKKAKTKRALVLDADELITKEGFAKLAGELDENPQVAYNFLFIEVYAERDHDCSSNPGHNPRLFRLKNIKYKNTVEGRGEMLSKWVDAEWLCGDVHIFHFMPGDSNGSCTKTYEWYLSGDYARRSPSKLSGFSSWKAFNPRRNEYD